jgi:hypothetical protein
MNEHVSMVYYDMVTPGMWHMVDRRPTPARILLPDRIPSRYGELTVDRVRVYPVPRFLPCRDYLLAKENESWRRHGSRRKGHWR